MDTTEGSAPAPESTTAPAATSSANDAAAAQQQQQQQKPPAHAPAPGTKYVLNPKTGLYDVHRVDDEGRSTVERGEDDLPEEEGKAAPEGLELEMPGHVPQSVQYNEAIQGALHELGGILRESAVKPEVAQSYVDVYTEYAMEHPAGEVDALNPTAVHAQLKALWGDTYGTRWGHVLKAWNGLSPKSQEWVANHAEHPIAMFRTLAAIGGGALSLTREQAQVALDKMRSERTVTVKGKTRPAPLYDVSHKDHKLYKDTFRNLSLVANREEGKVPKGLGARQGNVEEMVADRTRKEPAGDSPQAKLEAELKQLRLDPAYYDKSKPNNKAVVERVRAIYQELYP